MKVLRIIFGIMLAIFGIICMATPLYTALSINIFFAIMVAVYGFVGIIDAIASKVYGVGFVFSIISLLFGIALLVLPNLMAITFVVFFYMIGGWFILQGITSIVMSLKVRKITGSKKWIFQLILGILGVLLGIYTFIHPIAVGLTIEWILGILIGIFFIESGISMMFFSEKVEE